jgi:tRNA A-37 threonylcarbamoyl transferase component Bud32
MNSTDLDRIRADGRWREHRVAAFDTRDGQVLVKGQRPARSDWPYRVLNGLARASGLSLLKAAPAYGGLRAQRIEAGRLRQLQVAGVPVPALLHEEDGFIVMQYLGDTSLVELLKTEPAQALVWWERGLHTLVQVHARGQYLSQAFARNFIAVGDGLAMIDFEDDPLEVMSLAEAQARDWLAYLHSSVWLLTTPRSELAALLNTALAQEPAAVRQRVAAAARRLGWLRLLPRERKPWGRDVVSLQAVAELLHVGTQTTMTRNA